MILIQDNANNDVFLPEDIFEEIAENVLTNLKKHPIIGQGIEDVEIHHPDDYAKIVEAAANTIHKGITEFVDVNFLKEAKEEIISVDARRVARTELKNLFVRNMFEAASS
jgi:hypothetical protein